MMTNSIVNYKSKSPLRGWTRKNPYMTAALIFCFVLFFLLTAVFHLFKPA